jgi:hypothetical protein
MSHWLVGQESLHAAKGWLGGDGPFNVTQSRVKGGLKSFFGFIQPYDLWPMSSLLRRELLAYNKGVILALSIHC